LGKQDQRPPVWIGHVVLETSRLDDTEQFMRTIGMRPIVKRTDFAVLELRGGTHLVLIAKPGAVASDTTFDLMVEDIRATHRYFTESGFEPTALEHVPPEHERFFVRKPAGNRIAFFSNHVSGKPV
jgi:catechol 2,3-dioxygenase-like lactoylglutathione lyase family enzyme